MENHPEEGKSAKTEQRDCGRCGAKLDFAPGTSALKCPYCGFEMQIAQSTTQLVELDYRAFLEKAGNEKESYEAHRIQCAKCGAELRPEAKFCDNCGVAV